MRFWKSTKWPIKLVSDTLRRHILANKGYFGNKKQCEDEEECGDNRSVAFHLLLSFTSLLFCCIFFPHHFFQSGGYMIPYATDHWSKSFRAPVLLVTIILCEKTSRWEFFKVLYLESGNHDVEEQQQNKRLEPSCIIVHF